MLSPLTTMACLLLHTLLVAYFLRNAVFRPATAGASLVCALMPVGWMVVCITEYNGHDPRLFFPSVLTVVDFWFGLVPVVVLAVMEKTKPRPWR